MATIKITNLAAFNKDLKRAMKNAREGMEDHVVRKAALDTHRELQERTPRLSGRARAGWNSTVDSRASEWKPPKGKKSYSPTPFNGSSKIKFDSGINLSNNVEYIVPLDEGHSEQAENIVQFVLARMRVQIQKLTNKESKRKIK